MARVYLVDATNLLYRAYHAISGFRTSGGVPTNAVFGFLNMAFRLLKEEKPDLLAAVFDPPGPTLKHAAFADYKAHREAPPDDFISQIPYVHRAVGALGIRLIMVPGVEADDVIGTLAARCLATGDEVTIVTGDKDFCQLVGPKLRLLDTMRNAVTGPAEVVEKMGVPPDRVVDVLALSGDAVDNIPGVPGIGLKTAAKLVSEHGSLELVVASAAKIGGKKGAAIAEAGARVLANRELVTIRTDLDLSVSRDELAPGGIDREEAAALFRELEFKKFLADLDLKAVPEAAPKAQLVARPPVAIPPDWVAVAEYGGEFAFAAPEGALPLGRKIVGHGLKKFGAKWLELGIRPEELHFDTELAAYLLYPGKREYALTDLVRERGIPWPGDEPGKVARLILQLASTMRTELMEKGLWPLFAEIEMPLVATLQRMEAAGVKVDRERLAGLSGEYEKRIADLEEKMFTLVGERFNPRSTKDTARILFEKLKLPVVRKTATGASTDAAVLEELALSHPLPELLLDHRGLTKLKSSFIDSLPLLVDERDGRIHTVFNQTVAATGRLSSTNPNLQNIPVRGEEGKRIRQAFVAEPGFALISADYSQIELRILAHLSDDPTLCRMFATGRDIHAETAALLFDVGPLGVTSDMRRQAKVVNFGILYGMSPFGLARRLGMDVKAAGRMIDTYFARFPGVRGFLAKLLEEARATGVAKTLYGRTRPIPELDSRNKNEREAAERLAINTPIQGTAADIMKIAMLNAERDMKAARIDGRMILQVHDELVVEVREEETQKAVEVVVKAMERAAELSAPLKAQAGWGRDWLAAHGD